MLRICCPTLLALAAFSAFAADTDVRRDENARAIRALIDIGAKIPAQRQLGEWSQAGYADTSPSLKQALQDVYDQNFDAKFDESRMKKYDAKGLPPIVAEIAKGGTGIEVIVKLLNDTRRVLDPDAPRPMVTPTAEKMASLQRSFKALNEVFIREFATGVEKVKAHQEAEDEMWNLDEVRDKKRIGEIQFQAVMLRIDALKAFYYAHMALREAALRGDDFGLDPKAYNDSLSAFCKEYYNEIADWDFNWAEMHPQLQLFCAIVQGETARQGVVKAATDSEAEAAFFRVIDLDLDGIPGPARPAVRTVQANAWASVLRWRLEVGKAKPESLDRGIALFNDFKKRYGKDLGKEFALDYTKDIERAVAIGQVYITAGRLYAAKGDTASANNTWAEVKQAQNPLSQQATAWFSGGGDSAASSDWGQESLPADPSLALAVGRALIGEAQTANPLQARAYHLKAALGLRGALLGLSTAAFDDQFVANGPDVYRYYAYALAKLDMPYHAAAAAYEGLRQVGTRIDDKTNPWKDKSGNWTKDGERVQNLLSSALSNCSKLNSLTRSSATKRLYDDCVTLAGKIDPSVVGEGMKWMLVVNAYNEKSYDEAIDGAKAFAKEFPQHFVKSASLMLKAMQAKTTVLERDDSPAARAKLAEAQKTLDETVGKLEKWIDKQPAEAAAQVKPLRVAVISAKIRAKLKAGDFDGVFADLGPDFWSGGRVDNELASTMLKYLAQAVQEAHLKTSGVNDPKVDKPKPLEADALVAAWKRYDPVIKLWKKQVQRYFPDDQTDMKNSSYRLATMAQVVNAQAERHSNDPAAAEVADAAKLAFADFIEPFVDQSSKPTLILAVAQTLWDIGEKGRAVRLFELYKTSLESDDLVKSYRADEKGTVDSFAETFTSRRETKDAWAEIADLLYDPPGFLADLLRLSEDELRNKGQKRDFHTATTKIDALRKLIEAQGHFDAETRQSMLDAVAKLRQMSSNLAFAITIDSNLAQYYRETNQASKAVQLYRRLYEGYDPMNPLYAEGYVEGVLQALAAGETIAEDAIVQAREVAGRNLRYFQARPMERDSYWMSFLQVFELSKFLGKSELAEIKKSLSYTVVNKSTPRHDLIAPPVPGDDPGIARPRHALSVAIARRFLDLFEEVGLKRPFRIEEVPAGGKTITVFVDADVPAVEGVVETTPDGDELITIKRTAAAPAAAE